MGKSYIKYAISYFIAAIGVVGFMIFELPLPFLMGPIIACLIAALLGFEFKIFGKISNLMRTILGVAVGASITIAVLVNMFSIWQSLIIALIMVVIIGLIGVPYFYKIWKYDFATAYYASMPGGLQDMLLFGEEAGGNVRSLSLVHATRVMVLVMIIPIIMVYFWDVDLTKPPGIMAVNMQPSQIIIIMIAAAIVGWQVAVRLNMFGASILGPLILSGLLSILGILSNRPPAEAIWMAQFFLGIAIGAKYSGITLSELKRDIAAGLIFSLLLAIITVTFCYIIITFYEFKALDVLLAFAPGGQSELAVMALIVGADLSFVITHHLCRIFFVILMAPIVEGWINKKK